MKETQKIATNADAQHLLCWLSRLSVPLYCVFISYCALVPFSGWTEPKVDPWQTILYAWVDKIFLFDVIQNLLLYIPLGWFAVFSFRKKRWVLGLLYSFILSLCISTLLEYTQAYIPVRVPSALDIMLNTASAVIGALIALLFYGVWLRSFSYSTQKLLKPFTLSNPLPVIGFLILLSWGAYQWFPFIPSLHPDHMAHGYSLILRVWNDWSLFNMNKFYFYAMQGTTLYLLSLVALQRHHFKLLLLFVFIILPFKMLIMTRILALEAVLGTLFGLILCAICHQWFLWAKPINIK